MKESNLQDVISEICVPVYPPARDMRIIGKFAVLLILLFLSVTVFSQKQITDNVKCTYVANSFGGGTKWVQNYIENISVAKNGTVYTNSSWDEAHREYGTYTPCDVVGNLNKKPNSLVATDCNGKTWTVKNPYMRFMLGKTSPVPLGALAPYIVCSDGREIRSITDPTAIAIDNQCRLMVADNGPDQNIKVFDISGTGTPALATTIGVKGGALAGANPGIIEPLKFWGIRGIGTDSVGSLWVASCGFPSQVGGGTDLRHFDANLNMDCQMLGLAFVQSMDADPLNPTHIYSSGERYEIDYNAPAGNLQAHWKYKAQTLDPFKYPDDPRIVNSLESTFIRYIDGKKFMFLTNMYSEFICVYRFDGEIAVPCAFFTAGWDGQWEKYTWQIDKRPKLSDLQGNRWLWRDNNGDGQVQKEEFSAYNLVYPYIFGLDIDGNGNVYIGGRWLSCFPANGLDKNGVPNYSVTTMTSDGAPYTNGGGDMTRIKYVDETDIMYFGTGSGYPYFDEIIQFKNWSKGERNPKVLSIGKLAETFTADDKYIYVNLGARGVYTGITGEIDIWDAHTLEPVGYILPGDEVFKGSGMIDLSYGIKVSKLPGGERIIIIEEDAKGKNIVYKWCPDGNCVTPDFSVKLTSPRPDKLYLNNGNVLFESSVVTGKSPITKVEFYADNLKIGESTSIPYHFTWVNPTVGIHTVYAKAVSQDGLTAKSNYFGLKITDGKPEVHLESPSARVPYTMLDTIVYSAIAQDNGSVKKVEFFRDGVSVGSTADFPYRLIWDNPVAGQYTVYAKVTDDEGNTTETPTVTMNVTDQVSIPFISPVKDTIINEGAGFDVQLNTVSIQNIKSIAYYNDGKAFATVTTPPFLYRAENVNTGVYNFSAVITLKDNRQVKTAGPNMSVIPSVFDSNNTGVMNLDYWTGVDGSSISTIPVEKTPTKSVLTNIFESPTNFSDSYGERICGYICPPQTGAYTFWVSGNDISRLRIKMPDADTLQVLAYANDGTGVRSWDESPTQKSAPVTLQKGQMYVVEGLMKESSGDDNFAVGWQLPDGTFERPIPGERLTPLYNPLTINNDVMVKIISPIEGAILNKDDSVTIVAEVQKGFSDVTSVKFYSSTLKMIGEDKTSEANIYSIKTKLPAANYKLSVKAMYRHLIAVPSGTVGVTVKLIQGTEDLYNEDDLQISPNPLSSGPLTIKYPQGAVKLSVFDMTGKLVYQEKITKSESQLNKSLFKTEGVYFVNVTTDKNSISKKVIIIK
jgi:hypothetical protein